jgi:hypothetical protein
MPAAIIGIWSFQNSLQVQRAMSRQGRDERFAARPNRFLDDPFEFWSSLPAARKEVPIFVSGAGRAKASLVEA